MERHQSCTGLDLHRQHIYDILVSRFPHQISRFTHLLPYLRA
uniref:Uncharacterized protein n=1 Tax=Dulem virus 42 TaxID=3145760 RepID=A0AAU8BAN5_9CAUD